MVGVDDDDIRPSMTDAHSLTSRTLRDGDRGIRRDKCLFVLLCVGRV